MGKLNELKTTQEVVLEVLKTQEKSRNSDNYLCYMVYKTVGEQNGIDIDSMSIPRFFLNMKEYGFPSTETIRRTRQKLQHDHPELCGNSNVECQRKLNEEIFKGYARGYA